MSDQPGSTEGEEQGFRGPQVCKIVGITYRQLDHWDRTGLIRPSLASARGSGTQRRYSYRDVVVLKIIKQLLDSGVTLQRARKAIEFFRQSVSEDLSSASLVLGASDSVLARNGEELLDLLHRGQGVFNVVPLSGVVTDVDAGIHRFAPAESAQSAENAADDENAADAEKAANAVGRAGRSDGTARADGSPTSEPVAQAN
jgi:DNA-binding transcriptional MerR regulator